MRKIYCLIAATTGIFFITTLNAQISGTVFRDFNGNGVKDNTAPMFEPFVAGVTVKAFNAANVQVGVTKTTDAAGAYGFTALEIPSGTAVRIEFSGLGLGDYSSFNGTGNGTNVQFATAGAAVIVNYAVNAPEDYWDNNTQTDPVLAIVHNKRGRSDGFYAGRFSLLQINNTTTSTTAPASTNIISIDTGQTIPARRGATYRQTGSCFGLAFQQKSQRTFQTAALKRGFGFGPQGPGGIYIADKGATYVAYSGAFTLQGVTPSNGGGALDFGAVTRVNTPTTDNNYISNLAAFTLAGPSSDSRDNDAFAKVGTMSYGDIEADKATDKLYTINLFQKKLIVLDVENTPTATLNGASAATLSPLVRAYDLTTLTGWPVATGAGNNLRPYAVKVYKGVGYIGVVSDAMATQSRTDLRGYILSFDPNNIAAGLTAVLNFNFSSYGNTNLDGVTASNMKPWVTTFAQVIAQTGAALPLGPQQCPQPMIASIEFNENGSMDIGIRDRWGDQGAVYEFTPVVGSSSHQQTVIGGDILHACKTAGGWALEGTAGSCDQPAANTNSAAALNDFGQGASFQITGKEWYADKSGDGTSESSEAGLTKLMGSDRIITTVFDPMPPNTTLPAGFVYLSTQGVQWNNVNTGVKTQWARTQSESTGEDKCNGLGDLEFITNPQPIQIGNRIWNDLNGNGIQDANETTSPVAAGTIVSLYTSTGVLVATTTTDAAGNYYFSTLTTADPRKPATWTGVGSTILPGFDYRIEFAVPAGFQVTKNDAASNTVDNIDNDASLVGTNAVVAFNTSNTNHNFDIGIKPLATIGDKVWLDEGAGGGTAKNGVQDGTEPGVSGVTVELLSGGVVIATTVTDAFGNYLFDNLAAGAYAIRVTAPANHTFTTNTNTTDDNNTTGASTTGSDVNAITGQSYAVVLSAGENNRNIDAGLVFNTPTLTNSIGDRIWFDNGLGGGTAANGIQDGTEPGVAGVTVTLYDATGTVVIATTVTDANGNYIFTNLPAGTNYIIGVTAPAGTVFATTTGTTITDGNSDVNATLGSATYGKTTVVNTGVAGTQIIGIDAGIISQAANTASLGDRVWNDVNSNGTQDAGEPGIAGVTVNLYEDVNGDGVLTGGELTAVRTMVTDGFGNYIFNNLVVTSFNRWQLEFIQPVGYSNTPVADNNSGNDATDSDITNNATDRTGFIRLKADERNTKVDAGFIVTTPAGTLKLGDKVWRDDIANGQQDASEPGVPGVTVTLYQNGTDGLPGTADDVLISSTTTDINGNYLFTQLAASTTAATNYNVQFSNIPANFSFTTLTTGATATDNNANSIGRTGSINLTADDLAIDAGIKQGVASGLGSLGNKVWYDLNNNGLQDATETGAAGVTVNLYKDVNNDGIISGAELTAVASTTTNSLGEYMFTNLAGAVYQVGFTLPAGLSTYTLSAKDAGTDDSIDSDGNPKNTSVAGNTAGAQTSYTALIALAQGEDNITVDLGIVPPASTNTIGNKVWWDQNADGLEGVTEPGVSGVVVKLYNDGADNIAGNGDDVLVGTTTTDINGNYLFVGLLNDTYYANFSNVPAGFDFTVKEAVNVPATDIAGSDADRVSGTTGTVTLTFASGGTSRDNRSLDAGIISSRAALGNKIWDDINGDGVQNAGEPGVAGIQVMLYAADGTTVLASAITDANGNYLFANLNAGTYIVGVNAATIPAGMQFTQQNTPGDNGNDTNSDADPVTGKSAPIILSAGEADVTIDAGIRRTPVATVGNRVWDDLNGDGLQNAGEPGIAGVIATLYNSSNVAIGSAVTDGNGNWLINNVAPGTGYYIIFTNKPIGNFTIQDNGAPGTGGGTDTDTDSDVNAAGQSGAFDVTVNTINVKIDAGITSSILLPIKLESFTAVPQGSNVVLNWVVSNEINVANYEAEFSTNGVNYVSIGSVTAASSRNYNLLHTAPVTGINYYRLKTVDKDGKISYSDIRKVNFGKGGTITIYPNPTTDAVNITFTSTLINKPAVLSIIAMDGRVLYQERKNALSQTETISLGKLANGKYILQIKSATEVVIKTIEIIR
jgi:hypothetical protein